MHATNFLLLVDAGDTRALEPLPLPPGVVSLTPGGVRPTLSASPDGPLLLEPVHAGGRARLLLAQAVQADSDARVSDVRVNGAPVPRVALLSVGDELSVDGGPTLVVTRHQEDPRGPATGDDTGRTCPLCLTPVTMGRPIYRCDCGTRVHDEGQEREAGERLECARLVGGRCPDCKEPLREGSGFAYIPAGMGVTS